MKKFNSHVFSFCEQNLKSNEEKILKQQEKYLKERVRIFLFLFLYIDFVNFYMSNTPITCLKQE